MCSTLALQFHYVYGCSITTPHNEGTNEIPHSNLDLMRNIMQELQSTRGEMGDIGRDVTNLSIEQRVQSHMEGYANSHTQRAYGNYNRHGSFEIPVQSAHQFYNSGRHTTHRGGRRNPNVSQEYFGGYYGGQQGDRALDKIKWKDTKNQFERFEGQINPIIEEMQNRSRKAKTEPTGDVWSELWVSNVEEDQVLLKAKILGKLNRRF
ncbi:hypothetical protein M9H77_17311 [Catharanthus roseus]|uniref:Uncharacterized protein n=1 Tax=Catharanthus roseus TaxID=4058 RepID=A0ACC0B482_CATRO|nr:hypothetical protein M9H77_17311 [Catharanthus roseus]